jgi:hypothetical protein
MRAREMIGHEPRRDGVHTTSGYARFFAPREIFRNNAFGSFRADVRGEEAYDPRSSVMPSDDRLVVRIRGEYEEMPGLRLNLAQACRLWQLDGTTCLALLDQLVVEHFLHRTHDGAYVAFPGARPKPAKAALPVAPSAGADARRRA